MTQTPDNASGRVRWTDKMLDKLGSDVSELRESISELKDSVDEIRITSQALLQIAAQQQQENEIRRAELAEWKQESDRRFNELAESNRNFNEWRQESDRRFYTLLDEVRYLSRRADRIDGDSQQ